MKEAGIIRELLENCLLHSLEGKHLEKFNGLRKKVEDGLSERLLYLHFSSMPRTVGKSQLQISTRGFELLKHLPEGMDLRSWTTDQAGRTWLVLHFEAEDEEAFFQQLEKIFLTADMGESVALYQSLSLLPHPHKFVHRTTEGLRTNIVDVFDSIALDNPYPAEFLSESQWNQMVLKAAFMNRPIHRIHGLDKRANKTLAKIISDYAHERWAASRVVSPEFWRPIGPYLSEIPIEDIERLFADQDILQQSAAALVCVGSTLPKAKKLLDDHPNLKKAIDLGTLSWQTLAQEWWAKSETS